MIKLNDLGHQFLTHAEGLSSKLMMLAHLKQGVVQDTLFNHQDVYHLASRQQLCEQVCASLYGNELEPQDLPYAIEKVVIRDNSELVIAIADNSESCLALVKLAKQYFLPRLPVKSSEKFPQTSLFSPSTSTSSSIFGADVDTPYLELPQASFTFLQLCIDGLDQHVWIKDLDGRYIVCNTAVERVWKMSKAQIIGKTDFELFNAETALMFIDGDKKAIEAGRSVLVTECEDIDSHSKRMWLQTYKVPIYQEGVIIGVMGITQDIANHKAAEEQLLLAACVFENAIEGVIITDIHANIVEVNQAFVSITGYEADEVIGKNPRLFSSGRHDAAFFKKMWTTLLVKGKWNGEIWNRRKNGEIFPQSITISAVYDQDKSIKHFVGVFADISQQKQTEAKLINLAYYDALTQMPNRMQLMSVLEQDIHQCHRNNEQVAVICIDIDLFKHVNESYGHLVGDAVIVELSKRLTYTLGETDTIGRLGGDEFIVMLPNLSHSEMVSSVVDRIQKVFERPFIVENTQPIRLTASMGVSIYPNDADDADSLLRNADAAMHRAKSAGRNSFAFYTESMTTQSIAQLKLQSALHQALVNDEFYLVYQPKINIKTQEVIGFEALIRWHDEALGNISPGMFIPVAEKIGLINDIGFWVLERACLQGVEWLTQGKVFSRISVNVASQQLQRADFVDKVIKVLLKTGLPAKHLELEVTESSMMNDPDSVIHDLKQLGAMGISLSVDDFGTGYSSLNYLKRLPINILKIDQSFVRDIPYDNNNTAIAKAVIALAQALNLDVIAEGVETQEQAQFLLENGCYFAQGFLYSRPQEPNKLITFLKTR